MGSPVVFKLTSLADAPPACLAVLLYGPTGGGKTTVSRTLERAVVVAVDVNAANPTYVDPPCGRLAQPPMIAAPDIEKIRTRGGEDYILAYVAQAAAHVRKTGGALVIDDITTLSALLLESALAETNAERTTGPKPQPPLAVADQRTYGRAVTVFRRLLHLGMGLPALVLLAQEAPPAAGENGNPPRPLRPFTSPDSIGRVVAQHMLFVCRVDKTYRQNYALHFYSGTAQDPVSKASRPLPGNRVAPDLRVLAHYADGPRLETVPPAPP